MKFFQLWNEMTKSPPKIYDPDALDRMSHVEGEKWLALQKAKKNSPFGFFAYLNAWKAIEEAGEVGETSPYMAIQMSMVPGVNGGDGAIYGEGGHTRYYVSKDGTIRFDYGLARKEKRELAEKEGFSSG